MVKAYALLGVAASGLVLSGCSGTPDGEDYTSVQPDLDIQQFFNGEVKAWGIAQDRFGEVVQRFIVTIDGRMEGDTLVMDETFTYGVGEGPTQRTWRITPDGQGRFIGRAGDVDGPATGISHGNAFNFSYAMDLPVGDTTYSVKFDDWFFAFDDSTLMNRSYITKFGVRVAEVTIFMQRQ